MHNYIKQSLLTQLPGAIKFVEQYQNLTIKELGKLFKSKGAKPSSIVKKSILKYAKELLNETELLLLDSRLEEGQSILTANHHGFDSYPELIQGVMIFGIEDILHSHEKFNYSPIPVLATGNISLNSPTAPGGFVLGRRNENGHYIKTQLFKRSLDSTLVHMAPKLSILDLNNFIKRLDTYNITSTEKKSLKSIVDKYLMNKIFLEQDNFFSQASWFNLAVFRDRFLTPLNPSVIYIELESVCSDCLKVDLTNQKSISSRLLFDDHVRNKVLLGLTGVRGCWHESLLKPSNLPNIKDKSKSLGTIFFWEIDNKGQKHSLGLIKHKNDYILTGVNKNIILKPDPILKAIENNEILPSIFTCFSTLTLENNLTISGGIYQADYLPVMLKIAKLALDPDKPELDLTWTKRIASGFLPIRIINNINIDDNCELLPAGSVELAESGPKPMEFYDEISSLTIADLWPFSSSEWFLEEISLPHSGKLNKIKFDRWRKSGKGKNLHL